jgi:hypothetical protein
MALQEVCSVVSNHYRRHTHTCLLYRQWRRNRLSYLYVTLSEMANICSYWQTNTVKWKPFHCHLDAHHGTSVVLWTCVWQTTSQLWLLTFHTGVSCEHSSVVDMDFIVAYGRMHWQITTDRHVTSSQSLAFPIPLRWHKTLTGPRNKSLTNHRIKKRRDAHTSSFTHKLYPQNTFNSWNDTTGISFNAASLSLPLSQPAPPPPHSLHVPSF